jgi:lipopolysaccharide heptosyltransferase I
VSAGPAHPPRSLLVVRLGSMGDVVHTMHAVTSLRNTLPETRIGWVIEDRWAELLFVRGTSRSGARSPARPLVDFVHVVNTKAWRKSPLAGETRQQFSSALTEIREQQYELSIDFQGAIKSALLARLSGSGRILGMERPRESPARWLYSQRVPARGSHVVEHYSSLAEAVVGDLLYQAPLRRSGEAVYPYIAGLFPHDTDAEEAVVRKLQNVTGRIVVVNPGAGWGTKQWPTERYGRLAKALMNEGAHVLVNYGPGEEQLASEVHDSSGGAARPITCSLAELIALTRRASLFIGGDTGPLHLAAALGVPAVAIFGPTDPVRNGPLSHNCTVLRNPASRTSLSHTSSPDPGLLNITAEEVLAAARKLRESNHA